MITGTPGAFLLVGVVFAVAAVALYLVGYRDGRADGHRDGYLKGRATSRDHVSLQLNPAADGSIMVTEIRDGERVGRGSMTPQEAWVLFRAWSATRFHHRSRPARAPSGGDSDDSGTGAA